ncbi:hypothetical protein CMUS01_05572 [Colletotrichum musicola]|uniref:Peptidase C14 caspase domain-containing protein n=1 Tax=Colletotrichum musicola TaxID=2175873 RepID=A0A8H6KQS9_9PEZI|nr:hypothetical protein CMUS01_05572 [Colletotrichum musicola]
MGGDISTRWAVLIGIDRYSATEMKRNLDGCVADVQETKSFLENCLAVPPNNIDILTAAVGDGLNSQLSPTRTNVLKTLKNLPRKAKPGDFVYIHYSGHGDRRRTENADLKKNTTLHDEVLCTLEEDIGDVELGDILDYLAEMGLFLCVVLDCCHAGSATRHRADSDKIRCRSTMESPESREESTHDDAPGTRGGQRNMSAIESYSWLNRPRRYNLIAACQSYEDAQEITTGSRTHGALTYHLIESLRSFGASKIPVTYESLHQTLEPKFQSLRLRQQPLHLGDKTRIVFGTALSNETPPGLLTSVSNNNNSETVTLVDGGVSHVGVGDCFEIYRPRHVYLGLVHGKAVSVARVRVTEVKDFESTAEVYYGSLRDVQVGWLAKMSHRAQRCDVNVWHHGGRALGKAMTDLAQSSRDPLAPTTLIFDQRRHVPNPDFNVEITQQGDCRVLDRHWQQHEHLPLARLSQQFGVERLTYLIQHLSSYRRVAEMKNSGRRPNFTFHFGPMANPPSEYLSAWEWTFTNNEPTRVLYVAVLNLSPAYGVCQLYPGQKADAELVERRQTVSDGIAIEIPPLLTPASSRKGFQMRDVFKLFITTVPTNFSHYEIHDLTDNVLPSGGRNGKSVSLNTIAPWYVVEAEVISSFDGVVYHSFLRFPNQASA